MAFKGLNCMNIVQSERPKTFLSVCLVYTVCTAPAQVGGWKFCAELSAGHGLSHRLLWEEEGHGDILLLHLVPHSRHHLPL